MGTGLAIDTGDAFPVPQPEDGGEYSQEREGQHLLATMATRDRISSLEKTIEDLSNVTAELTQGVDSCGSAFDIQILDSNNRHFVCTGYLFINDGQNQYAPISPKVKSTGQRLEDIDCSSGGFAIGSQKHFVWLELEMTCPDRPSDNETCGVPMELEEAYINWGPGEMPEDSEDGETRYVLIATIPATPASGCRTPVIYSPAPAWLLFLCCPPQTPLESSSSSDSFSYSSGTPDSGPGSRGGVGAPIIPEWIYRVTPSMQDLLQGSLGVTGYYLVCNDERGSPTGPIGIPDQYTGVPKYKWVNQTDALDPGDPLVYNQALRCECLSPPYLIADTTVKAGWNAIQEASRYDCILRQGTTFVAMKSRTNRADVTFANLTPGTTYTIEIQAHDDNLSPGSFISSCTATCTTEGSPAASSSSSSLQSSHPSTAIPGDFEVTVGAVAPTKVTLYWTELAGSTSYQPMYRKTSETGLMNPVPAVTHPGTTAIITGLDPATSYDFRVFASGHPAPTPIDHATRTTTAAAAVTLSPMLDADGNEILDADGNAIQVHGPLSPIIGGVDSNTDTNFRVYWTSFPSGTTHIRISGAGFPTEIIPVADGSFTYTDLAPATSYAVKLEALDLSSSSSSS